MKTFSPLDDITVNQRDAQWQSYAGQKIEMRHGFSLELRANCDYSKRRFVYRIAEPHEIDFLLQKFSHTLNEESVCIDIGANVGYWSKVLAEVLNVGKVFSFEPDPVTFKILERNLTANENVELFKAALGSLNGKYTLYVDPKDSGDNTGKYIEGRNSVEVDMLTLDTFAADRSLKRLDFLKIDIQGGEVDFFKGAESTISSMRPLILVEIMSEAYAGISRFIGDFSERNSYDIYLIDEDRIQQYEPANLGSFCGNSNAFLVPR